MPIGGAVPRDKPQISNHRTEVEVLGDIQRRANIISNKTDYWFHPRENTKRIAGLLSSRRPSLIPSHHDQTNTPPPSSSSP